MWPLSHFIAFVLAFLFALGVLFFFATSIIALTFPQSPFRTPSTVVCERAFQFLSQKFSLLSWLKKHTNPHLFDTKNYILDAQAMIWIMENAVDYHAIQTASLSVITLPPQVASEGALQQNVPGAIIRLLMVADTTARQSAQAKLTHSVATDIVSAPLRALYHALRPLVLDSGRWGELKKNQTFQNEVAQCLDSLTSLNLNSDSSNLLWMIRFCVGAGDESPSQLMKSMQQRLEEIDMSDTTLLSSSLESLIQHAALLIHVCDYGTELMDPSSPAYGILFEMDRVLWACARSSSPPITVLHYIALTMIQENHDVPRYEIKQFLISEKTFVVPSLLVFWH